MRVGVWEDEGRVRRLQEEAGEPGWTCAMRWALGKEGVVREVGGEDGSVKVRFEGGEREWWFNTEVLTRVREGERETVSSGSPSTLAATTPAASPSPPPPPPPPPLAPLLLSTSLLHLLPIPSRAFPSRGCKLFRSPEFSAPQARELRLRCTDSFVYVTDSRPDLWARVHYDTLMWVMKRTTKAKEKAGKEGGKAHEMEL